MPMLPPLPPAAEPVAPILLIVFNRPDSARRVLDAVRPARPARLYVAADGPRPGHPTDAARCAETRALVARAVDWPCEVRTLFRDENVGCGRGPAGAITWFFEQETEGIVLEDDCVPTPGFFRFCTELLARYRADTRVLHISGNNLTREARQPLAAGAESYYFSGRVHSWGWATWRRAWQLFDFDLTLLPRLRRRGALAEIYPSWLERHYWLRKFEAVRAGPQPAHIWDYQWHFAVAAHGGLAIAPALNLVDNIGFGDDATHTFDAHAQRAHPTAAELDFPLRHPPVVLRDGRRDRQHFRQHVLERALALPRRLLGRLLSAPATPPVRPPARPPARPIPLPPPAPRPYPALP